MKHEGNIFNDFQIQSTSQKRRKPKYPEPDPETIRKREKRQAIEQMEADRKFKEDTDWLNYC